MVEGWISGQENGRVCVCCIGEGAEYEMFLQNSDETGCEFDVQDVRYKC